MYKVGRLASSSILEHVGNSHLAQLVRTQLGISRGDPADLAMAHFFLLVLLFPMNIGFVPAIVPQVSRYIRRKSPNMQEVRLVLFTPGKCLKMIDLK